MQQMGTPMDVYKKPANVFVARFIGSPSMNLFSGTAQDGFLKTADAKLRLPNNAPVKSGETLTLGIRPEDIILAKTGKGNMDTKINVIEHIGRENLLYSLHRGEGGQIVIQSEQDPGQIEVGLSFPDEKCHYFDKDGKRITQ